MAQRITRRSSVMLHEGLHPHYAATVRAMARFQGSEVTQSVLAPVPECDEASLIAALGEDTGCVVVQYPDILGRLPDLAAIAEAAHARGALLVAVVTEPVALGAIAAPGELGADIVVGEGQALGVGLQFGGPYLGLFATREKYARQMPGRLCGETVDAQGKRAFVLALSTREQHIRREKATSNICTNSGRCALAFSIHLTLLGENGLRALAMRNHRLACEAADRLAEVPGVHLVNHSFFNEFALLLDGDARTITQGLAERDVLAGVPLGRLYPGRSDLRAGLLVAVTETTTSEDIAILAKSVGEALA